MTDRTALGEKTSEKQTFEVELFSLHSRPLTRVVLDRASGKRSSSSAMRFVGKVRSMKGLLGCKHNKQTKMDDHLTRLSLEVRTTCMVDCKGTSVSCAVDSDAVKSKYQAGFGPGDTLIALVHNKHTIL